MAATLQVSFLYERSPGDFEVRQLTVNVSANDTAHGYYFGDRPQDNPGYSEFQLHGAVGIDQANDPLDVWRVEQRLRYLGFPSFGQNAYTGSVTANPRVPKELKEDGMFGVEERSALRAFYAITNLHKTSPNSTSPDYNWGIEDVTNVAAANVLTNGSSSLAWLNGYNAPHWMNIYKSLGVPFNNQTANGFTDGMGYHEVYATSWTLDLLKAWQAQSDALSAAGLSTTNLRLNGLTDSAYGATNSSRKTIHNVGNHSIGMGIDLGISDWIDKTKVQNKNPAVGVTDPVTGRVINPTINFSSVAGSGWDVQRAIGISNLLPGPDVNGQATTGSLAPNINPQQDRIRHINDQSQALRDFLALYAITRNDGDLSNNYGWDNITTQYGGSTPNIQRAALFGATTTQQSMIAHALIGGKTGKVVENTFPDMNLALAALGIDANPASGHNTHFHITIQAPSLLAIDNHLMTNAPAQTSAISIPAELNASAQQLLQQIQPQLSFDPSQEVIMLPLDVPPDTPAQYPQVVIAQASNVAVAANADRTIGVCALIDINAFVGSAINSINPLGAAGDYLMQVEHRKDIGKPSEAKITILQNPKHGTLDSPSVYGDSSFVPDGKYAGLDTATFLVERGGFRVKVIYSFHLMNGVPDGDGYDPYQDKKNCPKGEMWKISLSDIDATSTLAGFVSPSSLLNYPLKQVDVSLNFANLANGAVGETTGHSITLDDDGNGYGWFIDATPADNSEFLPTSNPNEFIAKPGSDAAGKMDLLTVLLHEYGHVFGLDHDASAHQLMSEELQPGVRRTVSDTDMAKLWSLVGWDEALRNPSNLALSPTLSCGTGEGAGSDPTLPFDPLSPLGLSFFFGFARRRIDTAPAGQGIVLPPLASNDPNAVTINGTLGLHPSLQEVPQHELATHSGVFNGDFGLADRNASQFGWSTRGNVSINNGVAELTESDRTLSGVSQAFVLPEGVKALRFTVEAAQFTANGAAPPDAFEVALLNSVTGLPAAGTVSLTHSDALFNLQADGTLTTAAGVTVRGLPSSTNGLLSLTIPVTVTVDVSAIPAGTSLKLYFDLLGLGAKGSRVVIDDVKLLTDLTTNTAPVAVNDMALATGITPVQIAVLANDTDAEGATQASAA